MHQSLGAPVQSDAHDAQLCRIGSYTLLLLVEDLPFSILYLKYLVPALCIHACAVGVHANAPRIRKANAGCNTECTLPHYRTLHMPKRAHRTLSSEFLFFS